jgi:hypothetical protein
MSEHDPNAINRLIIGFTDLQERWESDPDNFDWSQLQALSREGAQAYNEGAGPSFHALAIDGAPHTEFHERFLAYSLQGGFDPFKLSRYGSGTGEIPVIDHASLAEASFSSPSAARMRATLMEIARARFAPLTQASGGTRKLYDAGLSRQVEACAESIPLDLLAEIEPELTKRHPGEPKAQAVAVDPVEGYLSAAEMIVDGNLKPYG